MYEPAILGKCAYRKIPCSDTECGATANFDRIVIDWSAELVDLAGVCRWSPIGNYYALTAVYIVEADGAEFCKIGIADNPVSRLSGIQTGNWVKLSLHSVFWVWNDKARALEYLAHTVARKMTESRGEWIKMAPAEAAFLVLQAAQSASLEISSCEAIDLTVKGEANAKAQAARAQSLAEKQLNAARHGY